MVYYGLLAIVFTGTIDHHHGKLDGIFTDIHSIYLEHFRPLLAEYVVLRCLVLWCILLIYNQTILQNNNNNNNNKGHPAPSRVAALGSKARDHVSPHPGED
jgi:hypothetical protein